jgi:CheY-like chemotaxis protein
MKLWFVDDHPENLRTWASSFPQSVREACEFETFSTLDELLDRLTSGDLPDILFLDFYLGKRRGVEIVHWFAGREARPVLIAHSSMTSANHGMVREGADFYLDKKTRGPRNESVRSAFSSMGRVEYIVKHRNLGS